MVSTALYPIVQSTTSGLRQWTVPTLLHHNASDEEKGIVIRAIYRQVLGNAHVMESERLETVESQFKQGHLSVREFVRQLAKSELYRSRFFDNCYRYRAIELNFKHLLGRAPDDFAEMRYHSTILDTQGFAADIDTYLDGDEYQTTFGESIVPYYRGHQTRPGQSMQEFTNFWQLLPSLSSSDKDLATNNKARLTQPLLAQVAMSQQPGRDARDILAEVFQSQRGTERKAFTPAGSSIPNQTLQQTVQAQAQQIDMLQQQLSALRPTANLGATVSGSWGSPECAAISASGLALGVREFSSLQQQAEAQTTQIAALQEQIAEAQRYSAIADYRLNKWRSRVFNR
jgi:phycoerythrin-associated linker protein